MKPHQYKSALLLAALLVLGIAVWAAFGMERIVRHGQSVLIELAPVDPRSLMQGDYMALSFAIDRKLPRRQPTAALPRYAYVNLDAQGRASFVATGDQLPAPEGQIALRLRAQGRRGSSIGPNAFFFQEGHGAIYEAAKWGELRVAANGTALLVSLRDANLQVLGQQKW